IRRDAPRSRHIQRRLALLSQIRGAWLLRLIGRPWIHPSECGRHHLRRGLKIRLRELLEVRKIVKVRARSPHDPYRLMGSGGPEGHSVVDLVEVTRHDVMRAARTRKVG